MSFIKSVFKYLVGLLISLAVLIGIGFGSRKERKIKKYDDSRLDETVTSLEERQKEIKRQQREFDLSIENPGTHPDIDSAVRDWNEGNKDGKN